ncbi:MAG: hypothetical protein NTV32_08350 [Gammaproteobacteria bacterium]|jgi:hypothetical protein|nr:hypothetical protein [Gammaproteobacteria bacterium]
MDIPNRSARNSPNAIKDKRAINTIKNLLNLEFVDTGNIQPEDTHPSHDSATF